MRGITGIEVGIDLCVLVSTRARRESVQVTAVHGLHPEDGPDPRTPLSEHLRDVRSGLGFPRDARIVAWGLHQSASVTDAATQASLAPFLQAGFHIDDVMTPPQALAVLARQRPPAPGREGTAWLALNRIGAAIAIVVDGELAYSREFAWHYLPAATARLELLQRYTLVAHLAPELRHGLDVVRQQGGLTVDRVVTCGDLPDLRSLTMPLIEELDLEVETLDSLDGLDVSAAVADQIGDQAQAVRLAIAAGTGRTEATRGTFLSRSVRGAAAVLLVAVLAWTVMRLVTIREGRTDIAAGAQRPAPTSSATTARQQTPPAGSERADTSSSAQVPASPGGGGDQSRPAATTGRPGQPSGPEIPANSSAAARSITPPEQPASDRSTSVEAGAGIDSVPAPRGAVPAQPERVTPRVSGQPPGLAASQRPRVPLREPLPVVNSILFAPDRRLAVVDGAIVREGEAVGPRVLIRIEPDAVLLREPSGHEVRVPLRRRVGSANGS
jgi:hypothetical protein